MEELFKELVWKCYQNGLNVDHTHFNNDGGDLIEITELGFDENNKANITYITEGRTKGWHLKYKSEENELKRMHKEVDEFLERR